jgi:iron complex transport system ATP-binding protein
VRALFVHSLDVAYGTKPVLRNVAFEVEAGNVVGLIGPNGAGKTTLIRAVAGLVPSTGEIRYGQDLLSTLSIRARAERRAYVPQQTDNVFPYRVHDLVAMGLAHQSRWYGTPFDCDRVCRALEEVGFAGSADEHFDRLSGGERQQVMIARSLVQGAALLLLDEPTSALDLKHRARTVAAMRRRARQGGAVLMSMHDLNLAAAACDRLILLDRGRVAANGPPAEVIRSEVLSPVYGVQVVCGTHPSAALPTVELDPGAWA